MRLSCVLLVNLGLVGAGAASAGALDTPHTLHHTRTTPHLVEPHHGAQHAASHQTRPRLCLEDRGSQPRRPSVIAPASLETAPPPFAVPASSSAITTTSASPPVPLRRETSLRETSPPAKIRCPPGGHRRPRRHERHGGGDQPGQRAHPGDGEPEAGPLAGRRALLHDQAYGGHGGPV